VRIPRIAMVLGLVSMLIPGRLVAAEPNDVAALYVYPNVVFTQPGSTLRFAAVAYDRSMMAFTPTNLRWTTNAGQVDATGLVRVGNKKGVFTITASAGDTRAYGRLSVGVGEGTSATITPARTRRTSSLQRPAGRRSQPTARGLVDVVWNLQEVGPTVRAMNVSARAVHPQAHHVTLEVGTSASGSFSTIGDEPCANGASVTFQDGFSVAMGFSTRYYRLRLYSASGTVLDEKTHHT